MRKYKHLPQLHKAHFSDPLTENVPHSRRPHRLTPEPVPNTTLEKAASRSALYLNSSPAKSALGSKAARRRKMLRARAAAARKDLPARSMRTTA